MATFRESILGKTKPKTFRDLFPTTTKKPEFTVKPTEEKISVDLTSPQFPQTSPQETVSIDLQNLKPLTPRQQESAARFEAQEQNKITGESIRSNVQNLISKLGDPKQVLGGTVSEQIGKPLTTIPSLVESTLGVEPKTTQALQGAVTAATRQAPLVGRLAVGDEELQTARQQSPVLGTFKEDVPLVGGKDVRLSDVSSAAAGLGFTLAQYRMVNNALSNLGTESKLLKFLGGGKKAQFLATQGADLLADAIVQAPEEWAEALTNDKSLGEDVVQMLKNRGVDILVNAAIGGAIELPNIIKGLKDKAPDIAKSLENSLVDSKSSIKGVDLDTPKTFRESILDGSKVEDANTFRSKVVREVPTEQKRSIQEVLDKFDTQFIDDTAPFRRLETKVTGGIQSAEDSISKQARLFKGAPEAANEILRTEIGPAIKIAEDAGFSHLDLGDYALAVHAKDVNAAGLKSGFTDAEIADTIKKFGTPEMEQARQALNKVSDRLLGMMREDGLISEESLKALQEKWPNYMPLFRSFDDNKVEFSRGLSDSFSNVTAPIKTLKGSDREVLDPIESMVKNIYKTVDATRRNRVGTQLARLADLDVNQEFIRKLDPGELVGRKNVVNVTIDGQKVPFEVEPEIFKAFNNLDKESSNWLIKVLSKPASLLRAGATLTPEFAVRNPLRDIQNAFVVSKSGFNPVTDFAAGLASTMKKGDLYQQWLREGGGYGNILSMDRQAHKQALESVINQPVTKKFVNVVSPKGWLDLMRSISDITESATKVGEFRAALRSGATPQEAAFRARDLMDFARAGSSIRPANRVVAFLNANIQGKSKLIRAIKENPKGVTAKLATSMVLPSIGAYAATQQLGNEKQKRIIKDAPDWLKNTFWLVPVPGSDIVARIPKPFDISFAANATERFLDYTLENDPKAFDGFINQTFKDQSIPVMLTGVMPTLEALANYSFFREGPIIPRREEFVKREDQFGPETSEIAKLLAKPAAALLGEESNLSSPRAMDYILRTSAGGLGSTTLDGVDSFLDQLGIVDKPAKPSLGITQLPLVKGFTVNQASSGRSVGELYDLRTQLQREKGSARLDGGRFTQQPLLDFVNDATSQISDITSQIREITNSTTIDPDEKRRRIDKLNELRNNIAIEAMERIGK